MGRPPLWSVAVWALAIALASGCTSTPPPPPSTPGSVGIVPPQPESPVELWHGEPDTHVYAPPGDPDLLVVLPLRPGDSPWAAVVDWRANRELWRADTTGCHGLAALAGRLACATEDGIDWYDLRRGGTPTRQPVPHVLQLEPLGDGTSLAFTTFDLRPVDTAGPRAEPTFGVLDAGGVRWQRPVPTDGDRPDLVRLGVEGDVVFLLRSQDWNVWVSTATTTAGDLVSMPDKAAPPVRIAGTERLAYATVTPATTYLTDLEGREVARAGGGPTWSSRYDGVFVQMADDGSVRGRPVSRTPDTIALIDPEGKPLTKEPITGVLPAGLCGGVVYTITSEGGSTPDAPPTDPTYGLRAHEPDGTLLWEERTQWSTPFGALCDGTRLILQAEGDAGVSLHAFAREGRSWTLPDPPLSPGQAMGRASAIAGVGILMSGGEAPRLLGVAK